MLELKGVVARYGDVVCLHAISLEVRRGEIVTLVGANGAGKSTMLKTVSGLIRACAGRIEFEDADITKLGPDAIVALGVVQVPEGRRVFPDLSIEHNLRAGAYLARSGRDVRTRLDCVFQQFPRLAERRKQRAGTLSGGEQQMLAFGRAMMSSPRLLMLDEPSLGLAPLMVDEIMGCIRGFRDSGITILLVEQNANLALRIADRGYVMEMGKITLTGTEAELLNNAHVRASYLGADAGVTPERRMP
jgi:branched-chain amino acid transport system ATP-binding protein